MHPRARARRARVFATAFAGLALAAGTGARAQTSLERLGVTSFEISVDRNDVTVGETVNVVLDVKMAKSVGQLNNLTLPQLFGFDVVGDERSCVASGSGSDCTERLHLSPTHAGVLVIGPAQLEALNAAGKPTNYESNYVTIRATDASAATSDDSESVFGPIGRFFLVALIVTLVALAAFFCVMFFFAKRLAAPSAPLPVAPPQAPQPAGAVPDPDERFIALVRALEERPDRERVLDIRAELRGRVGAREEETLSDLTSRRAGSDLILRLLAIVERAAFVRDAHVSEAVREAIVQLRAVIAAMPGRTAQPYPPLGGPS